MKSTTLALLALVTSSLACIERAEPCDNGTFDGEINQGLNGVVARDFEGNAWGYALGDDAREQLAKCRTITGHLYGHAIDDSYFPNLESLGSIGTYDPWDKYSTIPLLTGWDQITELGGVLGTVERIEGFSQIRSIGTIEGLDVIGFNNLEDVGNLDVSNVPGLTSLETAGAVRLSYTADTPELLTNLRSVDDDLVFAYVEVSVLSFSDLVSIGGDFGVAFSGLNRFDGFAADSVVAGDFYCYGNSFMRGEDVLDVVDRRIDVLGDVFICMNSTSPDDACPEGFSPLIEAR